MISALLGTAFLLAGAAHAASGAGPGAAGTPPIDPVFDCYQVNYAWGFVLQGAAVDRYGTIWRYRMRGRDLSPPAIEQAGATFRAAAALRGKFAHAERAGSVAIPALQQHVALIAAAASGKLTTRDTGVRDAGSSTCHAYVADVAHARYRDVELGSDGAVADTQRVNDAPAAATLLAWLRSIGVAQ